MCVSGMNVVGSKCDNFVVGECVMSGFFVGLQKGCLVISGVRGEQVVFVVNGFNMIGFCGVVEQFFVQVGDSYVDVVIYFVIGNVV